MKNKFIVFSQSLPPDRNGNCVVLFRLLSGLDPEHYTLISTYDIDRSMGECLPGEYIAMEKEPIGGIRILNVIRWLSRLRGRVKILKMIVQDKQAELIVACTSDLFTLPVGYIAARACKKPCVFYMFDDYAEQWHDLFRKTFAKIFAWWMIPRVDEVIVPNEYVKRDVDRRYGINCKIVRNPGPEINEGVIVDVSINEKIDLVYTGGVYEAHFKAFKNILEVLKQQPDYQLQIYSSSSQEIMKSHGIGEPANFHSHLSFSEVRKVQKAADILFLPLSKSKMLDQVIMNAAPGKLGDYLNSGRPILAYVPKGCFVDYLLTKYKAGYVCTSESELKVALERLATDATLRRQIVENAILLGREFSVEEARKTFLEIINRVH